MLYPVESAESWAEKYGLKIKSKTCSECGQDIILDVPFASKNHRGFRTREHGCSEDSHRFTFKYYPNEEIKPSDAPVF